MTLWRIMNYCLNVLFCKGKPNNYPPGINLIWQKLEAPSVRFYLDSCSLTRAIISKGKEKSSLSFIVFPLNFFAHKGVRLHLLNYFLCCRDLIVFNRIWRYDNIDYKECKNCAFSRPSSFRVNWVYLFEMLLLLHNIKLTWAHSEMHLS